MLTRLQLVNFKGWEDTGPRRVAPLTVLFGSNSSGKTSLLQALLLLKQTAESSDRSRVLHTRDERTLVDLGPPLKRNRGRPWHLPAPVRFYGFPDEVRSYFKNAAWLADLALALERQLARIQYVGPLRLTPRRSYVWSGEKPLHVGTLGELAVPALLAARAERREIPRGTGTRTRYDPFIEVVAGWLKRLGVIDSFRVDPVSKHRKDYEVRVKRSTTSAEVLITDVGVGVSQVLPVIVHCFYADRGSTVIFEHPEIHLHPRVQADLADLLIEAWTRCRVQFIVESHSEHFLRRLQRRIAEQVLRNEDVALYVCTATNGRSEIEALQVDAFGHIRNWPKDFFDDEIGDLAAMTDATMRRQRKLS
jgi:predicted ATPase